MVASFAQHEQKSEYKISCVDYFGGRRAVPSRIHGKVRPGHVSPHEHDADHAPVQRRPSSAAFRNKKERMSQSTHHLPTKN